MSKATTVLLHGLEPARADRIVALLLSQGLDARAEVRAADSAVVIVVDDDHDAARRLVAEEYPYGVDAPSPGQVRVPHDLWRDATVEAPASWFGRGAWVVLAIAAVCVAVFVASILGEDAGTRSRMLALGAISWGRVESGEYWRLVTAIFLHFDIAHLVSNVGMFLLVAPPLAHILGPWRFLFVFLATGTGANIASHQLAPITGLKAGASGAIAGTLGALGGHALRPNPDSRFRGWQRLGALAAFYGLLIGFGPGRDNTAHIAGLLIGLVMGRLMAPTRS